MALLINKRFIDEGKTIDVYLFEALNNQIIIAIPDWFWSYQMAMTLDEETCFEAILMQLFVFKKRRGRGRIDCITTNRLDRNI